MDKKESSRGLSGLQKHIISEAYKNLGSYPEIATADILIKNYGFKQVSYGKIRFSREQIGMKRYLSGTAAVARSLTRLRNRGLMIRNPGFDYGHCLTSKGQNLALRLLCTG